MTTRFAVRAGEGRTLALACLAFFSVLAAYYVIRPVRDQLAGAVGSIALPLFYAATFVATLLITPLFGWLVAHLPRRRLLAWSYGFFIVCLIGFAPLFAWQDRIGART
ncbi:MAG TPA: translocase, partial [Mizugakiibacter sp.]